ncbi:MAG TPA: BatA and WFA domain-containing protein, partial [Chthoniobacteraceae bacterium]
MRLIFQNPLWLLGALALVPLLAHLFSRTRPRRREFPSIWLLREAMRRVTRVRRPRDRWLLLFRTLAMAALALAFLQPLLLSRLVGRSTGAKTAVLVVDVSASMGYADGTRTRLAQAAAAAEEWLTALPANSRANIVWAQAQAGSVLPEPGANREFLRSALRQVTVRAEVADVDGALALALKQLAEADGDK